MYNSQELFMEKYKNYTHRINNAAASYNFLVKLPKSIFELFIFVFLFLLIATLYYSNNNNLLISYLSVLAVSVYKIIPSLNKISSSLQTIQYFATPFKEIVSLLKIDEEKPVIEKITKFNTVSYKNLDFAYNNSKPIFKSLNFEIIKNDFIGIYGPSGSGKSTFIKIVCGLLKPQNGTFLLDNIKIKQSSVHNLFSYVPQEPFIMDEDIIHNISFSFKKKNIDMDKIIDVLIKVELYEKFKDKMNEKLGENGIKISGGQKQRIAIARALYHKKQVIVLDESTSNLDPNSENNILDLLVKINNMVSIIFISHKQKSLKDCNKLYRINNNIIEKIK